MEAGAFEIRRTSIDDPHKVTRAKSRGSLANEKPVEDDERMMVDDFAAERADLVATICTWNLEASLSLCGGLLLCPTMHAYTYSIEILIHVVCVHSTG